tara:strand:+ start:2621 stop:3967 length:1347 start_codon:yes stop_codon:yes gene_type:complete
MSKSNKPSPILSTAKQDTGLGFHFFPDSLHYSSNDIEYWLPELQNLGANWITLHAETNRSIPETFLSPLLQSNIEPIIHIKNNYIDHLDTDILTSIIHAYANWEVKYVCIYDSPNMRHAWKPGEFDRKHLVDRFLDLWIPIAMIQLDCGLSPILSPLHQGGTYWDTSFLSSVLTELVNRKHTTIIDNLILAIYAMAGPYAADWGRGGNLAWPASKPYLTPSGSQDQTGFWSFNWYAEIMENILGEIKPMIMIAGGARKSEIDLNTKQTKNIAWHTTCNSTIAHAMISKHLPEYLMNVNYWLLTSTTDDQYAEDAWILPDNTFTAPAATELRSIIMKHAPNIATLGKEYLDTLHHKKNINHYILLPKFEWGLSDWHWNIAGPIARENNACCGFSVKEAALANTVTLIGDNNEISTNIENKLKNSGCQTIRINQRSIDTNINYPTFITNN